MTHAANAHDRRAMHLGEPPRRAEAAIDARQASARRGERESSDREIEDAKPVLVAPSDCEQHHVDEVCERAIHIAHVAVVDIALSNSPRDVLENTLVARHGRERGAVDTLPYPHEWRQGHEHGRGAIDPKMRLSESRG